MASPGGGRPAQGFTSLRWHHILKWNHNATDLWWRSFFRPHLDRKLTNLAAKTFFFALDFTYFWAENPLIWRQWPFFFLVFTYFWTEKGLTPRNPTPGATIPNKPLLSHSILFYVERSECALFLQRSSGRGSTNPDVSQTADAIEHITKSNIIKKNQRWKHDPRKN